MKYIFFMRENTAGTDDIKNVPNNSNKSVKAISPGTGLALQPRKRAECNPPAQWVKNNILCFLANMRYIRVGSCTMYIYISVPRGKKR